MPKSTSRVRPSVGEQHVAGLHVAVHDALLVGVVQGLGDVGRDTNRLALRERPVALDARGERLAVDELHDDGRRLSGVVDVVDADDHRVRQACRGARLRDQALPRGDIGQEVRVEPLHGHRPIELLVAGAPHLGASARGDALDEPVSVEDQLLRRPLVVMGRGRARLP